MCPLRTVILKRITAATFSASGSWSQVLTHSDFLCFEIFCQLTLLDLPFNTSTELMPFINPVILSYAFPLDIQVHDTFFYTTHPYSQHIHLPQPDTPSRKHIVLDWTLSDSYTRIRMSYLR